MISVTNKILVFIPAYNCENQISRVLSQFSGVEKYFSEILVVDNISTDSTLEKLKNFKSDKSLPLKVVQNLENYGLGGSHKVAFDYSIEHKFDYVVVLHGDDQAHISDLIPYLKNGDYLKHDCLLGSRFMDGSKLVGYSKFRTFGNHLFNFLFSMAAGKRIYDLGSGLNLYKVESLAKVNLKSFPDNLTFNYSMILGLCFWKWNIKFFPISWREDDQISNVKVIKQSFQTISILGTFLFNKKKFFSVINSRVYKFKTMFS